MCRLLYLHNPTNWHLLLTSNFFHTYRIIANLTKLSISNTLNYLHRTEWQYHAQRISKITALNRAQNRGRKQKDTKSNQSWKSNSNPEWNARDGERARVWSKRRKRVSKNERRQRQENVEGARKNGWLAVLADQISRMVRAPLNRSYFRSCSERARLTRRKTFDEYPREPLQEDSSILSFPPNLPGFLRPENRSTDHPRVVSHDCARSFVFTISVRFNDIDSQNKKSGTCF